MAQVVWFKQYDRYLLEEGDMLVKCYNYICPNYQQTSGIEHKGNIVNLHSERKALNATKSGKFSND